MSSRVYVDTRTNALVMMDALCNEAISSLAAQESAISCGHADVVKSHIDVGRPSAEFTRARLEDKIDVADTAGLQAKLKAEAPDYSVKSLGDWKPAVGSDADVIHVEEGKVENKTNMTLVKDFECAALDGARMMIFEVNDGLGNKSYQVGLEDILFDDNGEWKNTKAKTAYENFLAKAVTAQKVALEEAQKSRSEVSTKMRSAFRAAGLDSRKSERLPTGATHTVFTDAETRVANAELKTMKVGGKDN